MAHKVHLILGLFHHAPIEGSVEFDVREDFIHSIFASLTGFGFTAFAVTVGFMEKNFTQKIIAFIVAFIAVFLSILNFSIPSFMGIWQRLMFIISFAWLLYFIYMTRQGNSKEDKDKN